MKKRGVDGMTLGVDFIDINMIKIFEEAKIKWADGMAPVMEARAVKNHDEHECMRQVGAIGDAAHWEFVHMPVVINCECEMSRIGPGDILVTRVAGPALSHILHTVAGVVTERGGSTSHMASLARERGITMVLGVLDATERISDGAMVAVDGVAGVVRWMH